MKSNYDILGNHIRLIDTRNRESITDRVLGINIDKFFMPSVANVIGTDLSKYKLITKGKFACNPMHVGRDERLPVALYDEEEPAIVSPAYFMFEVVDNSILNFSAASAELKIIPPLGPRSVLWVVVVTTSAYGIGLGCAPPATRPAMCAISTIKYAPTSSQISLNFLKSITLAYALAPAIIIFGLHS